VAVTFPGFGGCHLSSDWHTHPLDDHKNIVEEGPCPSKKDIDNAKEWHEPSIVVTSDPAYYIQPNNKSNDPIKKSEVCNCLIWLIDSDGTCYLISRDGTPIDMHVNPDGTFPILPRD
jgi:hypothetical protein